MGFNSAFKWLKKMEGNQNTMLCVSVFVSVFLSI